MTKMFLLGMCVVGAVAGGGLAAGCSSSSSGGSSSSSGGGGSGSSSGSSTGVATGCQEPVLGIEECYLYSNLTSDEVTSENADCQDAGGSIVSRCPADNQIGCCKYVLGSLQTVVCHYCNDASSAPISQYSQQCQTGMNGTWTPGTGACVVTGGDL